MPGLPLASPRNLQHTPPTRQHAALALTDTAGTAAATIENKPGKAGSLAVYAALAARHGSINAAAAEEGLAIFAEHTDDARAHPGKHPNIDRLLDVLASGQGFTCKLIAA